MHIIRETPVQALEVTASKDTFWLHHENENSNILLRLHMGLWGTFVQILRGFRAPSFLKRSQNGESKQRKRGVKLRSFCRYTSSSTPFVARQICTYPITNFSHTCLGIIRATASTNAVISWVHPRWSPAQYTNIRHVSHKPTKGVAGHQIWWWTKRQVRQAVVSKNRHDRVGSWITRFDIPSFVLAFKKFVLWKKKAANTSTSSSYRGADKSLVRPGRKQAASVKSVMGRGMDWFG